MRIKSVKRLEGTFPTWDLDVEGVHEYLLSNGVVSHNTSNILGNTECFEPITSNMYTRSTLAGEFIQINRYLVKDLQELGLWSEQMRQKIIACEGSVQYVTEIPQEIKDLYKTVWEIKQKVIIDLAAGRAPYVCQSQSMNLYFKDADYAKLSSAFMYGWKRGLKTIVYYVRTQAAREAQKFTVDKSIEEEMKKAVCSIDNPDDCLSCGS